MSPKVIESKRVPGRIWIGTFANKIFWQKIYIPYPVYRVHCIYTCMGKLGYYIGLIDQNIYIVLNSYVLFTHIYFYEKLSYRLLNKVTAIRITLTILTVCGPEWGWLWWPVDWSTITFRWLDWADPKVSKYRWEKSCSSKMVLSICHIAF